MADRLAEPVPSDLEDVDTEFDDESNRWFAREFYAVRHECSLIKKMRDHNRQRVGVVKLHRTGTDFFAIKFYFLFVVPDSTSVVK